MGIVQDKIKALREREAKILQMGGKKAVARHKETGKLTARERLNCLFDKGNFPRNRYVCDPPVYEF